MRKFLAYFHNSISDALVYRATGFIWMLNDLGPALVMIIFWLAAFQTKDTIAGYTLSSMVFYYFGVMMINSLIATHPQYFMSEEIRSGAFSNYLVKPVKLAVYKLASALAWRAIRVIFFIPIILILWQLFPAQLTHLSFSLTTLVLFIFSLSLSLLINFFIKMILGLTTIWFTEAGWLFLSFNIVASLFSGEMIPLDLLPSNIIAVNNFLPFKYLVYFPLSLILNKISTAKELFFGLSIEVFWVIFFYCFYRLVLRRGIKNYCAYGG
ncbi:ABC-2 family transporter protein [Microgenomates group bacterium]|nr:ABC-2 family transporter protein [Microgenomates group bacterium]